MARTFAILLVTFAAAAAAQPTSNSPICCKALTAQCLACARGVSVEEYCSVIAAAGGEAQGCPTTAPWRPVPGASCAPGAPDFTSTTEHCGKRVVDMKCTCSGDGTVDRTDPAGASATHRFAWVCATFKPLPCKPEPTTATLPPPVQCSLIRCAEGFSCVPGRGCIKDTTTAEPRICCKALTAQCLACARGVSVEEYCSVIAAAGGEAQGCPTTAPWRPVPGASCAPGAPDFTSTTEHCGKRVVDMKCTCSGDGTVDRTDPAGASATHRFAWVCAAFKPLPCKPEPTTATLPPPVQCSLVRCAEGFSCVPGRGCIKDGVTVTVPPRHTTAATPSPCEAAQKAQLAALEQAARVVHAQMEVMVQSLRQADIDTSNLEAESTALKRAITATGCTE